MTTSVTFRCGVCGNVASTVTLVAPGLPDPRSTTDQPGAPPGLGDLFSTTFPDHAQLAIDGGPVSVTHGLVPMEPVAVALETGDAAALFAIDREYAPFWCPECGASYCREHYQAWQVYDEGFYDCTRGRCPNGHERMLDD